MGLARGRKRNRSLFELMDPKGAYRAPIVASPPEEKPAEPDPAIEKIEKVAEPTAEDKKESSAEVQPEEAIEPFLVVSDEKVRLVMNYPLAIMLCFAVVILLICAALVGWRIGRDNAAKNLLNVPKYQESWPTSDIK
ncbi:MAG: hypothetical protein GWP14_06365 [Actinobacteria bacterium]|nr:hypothetical protein [Actinomycetota bacterium]